MSNIAYHNYLTMQLNQKIMHANNLKTDFLANMSHEIRTPMNAVIGMAEMALREELSPTAQDYITQIKTSGKNLLAIINDILDFSKIESGKMEITLSEYEPMSLINDIASLIITHIGNKNIQLILDVDPNIPFELLGDSMRIKQILVNLSNNAIKFTKEGYIILKLTSTRSSDGEILLHGSIQDTGIGIKRTDMPKLFQSFQQLDSKRNRNLEGTGLGLAITRHLLSLMRGSIHVESAYGKGSRFSFTLPQRIARDKPAISLAAREPITAVSLIADSLARKHFGKDIKRLGVGYIELKSEAGLTQISERKVNYLFIEQSLFTRYVETFLRNHPKITAVLIIGVYDSVDENISNLIVVRKPVYSLNLAKIFNREALDSMQYNTQMDDNYEFTAPDARILIVDDNAINLTIAEGLLKPLKMTIDTATSGKEAINKITLEHYDLIFMDHMMPDLDGIKTTHIIRRFHEEYAAVPIIAFSANALPDTEAMFLREGLNDSVAKPIELRMLISKLKRWLPKDKIQRTRPGDLEPPVAAKKPEEGELLYTDGPKPNRKDTADADYGKLKIEGLDTDAALSLLGNEKLLWAVLKDYYKVIEKKALLIRKLEIEENWKNYTIEVHALKSASRQIGANELADLAYKMEQAGNACDAESIHKNTSAMLERYLHYAKVLAPYFQDENKPTEGLEPIPPDTLQQAFRSMREAIQDLDMDMMEQVVSDLSPYHYESWQQDLFEQLQNAVEELDVDTCESVLNEWENKVSA